MTLALSGTNGLLQSYDYQTPTTGFSYTFAAGTQVLVMNPAGTLATGTITMPAAPVDGMTITFSSSQQITALTMAGNGASLVGAVTFLPAKTGVTYVYRATGTTWYPTATVPGTGSQLVQGTAVTLTSQTNVDFTGIPSWVKRVTIMLNAASVSSTTPYLMYQLGYGATPTFETTGYLGNAGGVNSAPSAIFATNSTAAFVYCNGLAAITDTLSGSIVLTNVSGNIWTSSGVISRNGNNAMFMSAGSKTISGGALTAIRFTTSSGTDQYDAGSINILYE